MNDSKLITDWCEDIKQTDKSKQVALYLLLSLPLKIIEIFSLMGVGGLLPELSLIKLSS